MFFVLNKSLNNPHTRCEMMMFVTLLLPRGAIQPEGGHDSRDDSLYKDVFFTDYAVKEYVMEAIINVYIEAERTGYY